MMSLVSLMHDRQPGNNYLQVLGLTPRQAAAATLLEASTATGGCLLLALFSSWLWALANRSPEHPVSVAALAAPYAMAGVVLLGAASAVVWGSVRAAGVSVVPDRDTLVTAHDTFGSDPLPQTAENWLTGRGADPTTARGSQVQQGN
jgi:hypothetical protein